VAQLSEDVRSALRFFAFYLANGTLVLDLLGDFDYRSVVMEYGSGLEQVFAIFANVLDVNEAGQAPTTATRNIAPPSGSVGPATARTR